MSDNKSEIESIITELYNNSTNGWFWDEAKRKLESYAKQVAESKWISAEDKLPERGQDVLWGCVDEDTISHERYLIDMPASYYVTEYTHWQPLPKKPEPNLKQKQ